jgi:uncharacterized hydrophobic protein (TIGR00271 family)
LARCWSTQRSPCTRPGEPSSSQGGDSAGSIAAIAVLTNNSVLVVGAMIVSPDYGPMAALSVALVNRAWRSFRALALGFPMAALAALLLTLAARGLGRIPAPYLAGERPLTGLLIGVNLGAFVVAFVAGAAGIIALGRAKSGAVVGVLVSITTIPAASNVGVALAMGSLSEAGKSLLILLVNLAGLLAGGVLTLLGTRVWARRIESGRARFRPTPEPKP